MSNDLHCEHPEIPALHIHSKTQNVSLKVEGEAKMETVVVCDESHCHSPWLGGTVLEEHTKLTAAQSGHLFRLNDDELCVGLPEFTPATPVRFQFHVRHCETLMLTLPKGYTWSSASWHSFGTLKNKKQFYFAVEAGESKGMNAVITVQSRALCVDGDMKYVLHCQRV